MNVTKEGYEGPMMKLWKKSKDEPIKLDEESVGTFLGINKGTIIIHGNSLFIASKRRRDHSITTSRGCAY